MNNNLTTRVHYDLLDPSEFAIQFNQVSVCAFWETEPPPSQMMMMMMMILFRDKGWAQSRTNR